MALQLTHKIVFVLTNIIFLSQYCISQTKEISQPFDYKNCQKFYSTVTKDRYNKFDIPRDLTNTRDLVIGFTLIGGLNESLEYLVIYHKREKNGDPPIFANEVELSAFERETFKRYYYNFLESNSSEYFSALGSINNKKFKRFIKQVFKYTLKEFNKNFGFKNQIKLVLADDENKMIAHAETLKNEVRMSSKVFSLCYLNQYSEFLLEANESIKARIYSNQKIGLHEDRVYEKMRAAMVKDLFLLFSHEISHHYLKSIDLKSSEEAVCDVLAIKSLHLSEISNTKPRYPKYGLFNYLLLNTKTDFFSKVWMDDYVDEISERRLVFDFFIENVKLRFMSLEEIDETIFAKMR